MLEAALPYCKHLGHVQTGQDKFFAQTNFDPEPPVYMDPCKFCCSGVYTDPFKNSSGSAGPV